MDGGDGHRDPLVISGQLLVSVMHDVREVLRLRFINLWTVSGENSDGEDVKEKIGGAWDGAIMMLELIKFKETKANGVS